MKTIIVFLSLITLAGACLAVEMPQSAKDIGCINCHAIDHKIVGPAWADVSRKYKGVTEFEYNGVRYPLLEGLVKKVSKGGTGHWGDTPMVANDVTGAKHDQIVALVKFVLALSDQPSESKGK